MEEEIERFDVEGWYALRDLNKFRNDEVEDKMFAAIESDKDINDENVDYLVKIFNYGSKSLGEKIEDKYKLILVENLKRDREAGTHEDMTDCDCMTLVLNGFEYKEDYIDSNIRIWKKQRELEPLLGHKENEKMDLIKEISSCRNESENELEANIEIIDVLSKFVKKATPYPHDISEEELRKRMKENGVENFKKIGNMLFAVDEHGSCAEGFKLGLNDFYLKCYNNRMFGIFKD